MPAPGPDPGSGFRQFLFLILVFLAAFVGGYAGAKWGKPVLEKPDGPLIPYVGTAGVPVKVALDPPTTVFLKGQTPPSSTTLKISTGTTTGTVMLRISQSAPALTGLPVDVEVGAYAPASVELVLSPDAPTGTFTVTLTVLEKGADGAWIETEKKSTLTFTVQ